MLRATSTASIWTLGAPSWIFVWCVVTTKGFVSVRAQAAAVFTRNGTVPSGTLPYAVFEKAFADRRRRGGAEEVRKGAFKLGESPRSRPNCSHRTPPLLSDSLSTRGGAQSHGRHQRINQPIVAADELRRAFRSTASGVARCVTAPF
eukprot:1992827-Pyramimonas_sp.AAC.2